MQDTAFNKNKIQAIIKNKNFPILEIIDPLVENKEDVDLILSNLCDEAPETVFKVLENESENHSDMHHVAYEELVGKIVEVHKSRYDDLVRLGLVHEISRRLRASLGYTISKTQLSRIQELPKQLSYVEPRKQHPANALTVDIINGAIEASYAENKDLWLMVAECLKRDIHDPYIMNNLSQSFVSKEGLNMPQRQTLKIESLIRLKKTLS